MKRGAKTFSCWLPIITNFLLLKAFHTLIKLHVPQQFPPFLEIPHPADRMTFTSKALNRVLTYTYELPMGVASQNRFWLKFKNCRPAKYRRTIFEALSKNMADCAHFGTNQYPQCHKVTYPIIALQLFSALSYRHLKNPILAENARISNDDSSELRRAKAL